MRHLPLCDPQSPARIDPECFFAATDTPKGAQARALCAACPFQEPCLKYGLEEGVPYGIWGGLGPEDRKKVWAQSGGMPAAFTRSYLQHIEHTWTRRESA